MPNTKNGHFTIGAVSSGTLRSQDLLRTFADVYQEMVPFNGRRFADDCRDLADTLDSDECTIADEERASEAVNDLMEEINYALADGNFDVWFGASEGDGACFGFWPNEDD